MVCIILLIETDLRMRFSQVTTGLKRDGVTLETLVFKFHTSHKGQSLEIV